MKREMTDNSIKGKKKKIPSKYNEMPHSHYTYPFQAHLNTQALPKPSP
jgi:hypothetical protein